AIEQRQRTEGQQSRRAWLRHTGRESGLIALAALGDGALGIPAEDEGVSAGIERERLLEDVPRLERPGGRRPLMSDICEVLRPSDLALVAKAMQLVAIGIFTAPQGEAGEQIFTVEGRRIPLGNR